MATKKPVSLVFQQENYEGEMVTSTRGFNDVRERIEWVKQARYSANYINKPFIIVSEDVNFDGSMKTWQDYAKEEPKEEIGDNDYPEPNSIYL